MPKTQAEIILAVRERLDEATAGQWSDTELRRWINKGARDLCRRTECLDTTTSIAIASGTATVTGPTDMIRCSHVDYKADGDEQIFPLYYRDFNALDPIWFASRAITQSRPQMFTITGFVPTASIRVYPIPSETGTLQVKYYKLPAELATANNSQANTALGIPEGWDDAVECYVEYMALRKDRDPRWQEAKALYEEAVDTLYNLSRRLSDQTGTVVPELEYGGLPAWLVEGY